MGLTGTMPTALIRAMFDHLTQFSIRDQAALAETETDLLPPYDGRVANATVYTNVEALNPAFGRHLREDIYVDRPCALSPVRLGRMPAGAVLHGGGEFLLSADGALLREQIAPYLETNPARVAELVGTTRPIVDYAEECLLLARFGLYTWGHWLGELLPKAVLVEAAYPGRFRYVVPSPVLTDPTPHLPWIRIRESLLAYGIDSTRLLTIDDAQDTRFRALHIVGSVWSDHLMHPGAMQAMRERLIPSLAPIRSDRPIRAALMREGDGRAIENAEAVQALLRADGFAFYPVGRMRFWDQVRLFQSAETIFAILGSDLTGLIYAQQGVRVISVAPSIFGDRFFYAMILDRNGHYADIRGPVGTLNTETGHRSSFTIDPAELRVALDRLGAIR